MTESGFVKYISDKYNIKNDDAKLIVDIFSEAIESALTEGNRVEIKNLGAFGIKKVGERNCFNPYKLERMTVDGCWLPTFKFTKNFRLLIKGLSLDDDFSKEETEEGED